ncbi:MAG: SDR family oxidoreductase [Bacteroidetes bacterium]|nr:SDR family oxidoreductase [Bacteroidota bacterium]
MESLKGKKIILTGATGGIGQATAQLLAASQAQLFFVGRNAEKLEALSQRFPGAAYYAIDLTHTDAIAAMGAHYTAQYGVPDILIHTAGIGIIRPIEQLTEADFLLSLQTNLISTFCLLKAFLPGMKEVKKGLIVNIPGVLGKAPMAGAAAYSASKYGLVGMLQSVREEIKRTDIRITNLILGGVDSPFWDNIDLRVQKDKMIRMEEAARAIWFLCQQPAGGVVSEMVLQPFNHQAI